MDAANRRLVRGTHRIGRGLVQFRVSADRDPLEVRDLLVAHQRYHRLRSDRSLLTLGLPVTVVLSVVALAWPEHLPAWLRELAFGATAALLVAIPVVLALELGAYRRMVQSAGALDREPAGRSAPEAGGGSP